MLGELFWMVFGAGYLIKESISGLNKYKKSDQYSALKGFNPERQSEVDIMAHNARHYLNGKEERRELGRILGREVTWREADINPHQLVYEVSLKEGWVWRSGGDHTPAYDYEQKRSVHKDPKHFFMYDPLHTNMFGRRW